jgi:hypothetical protein
MVAFMSLFCPFLFLQVARIQSNPGDYDGWFFITAVAAWASTRSRFPAAARLQNGTGCALPWRMSRTIALLTILLLAATPVAARDSLGMFDRWGAFRDPATPRCYAIARPAKREGQKSGGFASVGTWPRQRVRGQVHFRLSRSRADKAPVMLSVGERRFTLVAGRSDAWAADPRGDAAIIAAMRSASSMSVQTSDAQGRPFADSYALRGAATAIDAAALGCARLR